ncbi:MAG: hydroxyacid dehydrogenase [Deltaproteobacteria bacterium]|nr:hydroxyacid dehydrogenase [Deltaproteobacteria bacterium]MBW2123893.1 hydroxyacid dehydrogenase [Deltaproteobacteria bacterium]
MDSRFKVLLYEPMHAEGTRLLEEKCRVVYADSFDEEALIRQASDVDGIVIRANGSVSRPVIESAPRLKVIGRHGVGLENIDLKAARERGITVVYTPDANTESVAEHFVALALMLAKKMVLADRALRAGTWQARYELIGEELRGKTLGVMGFGRIGQQTARICRYGFGMAVLYHDLVRYPRVEKELGAKPLDPETLFAEADFVSINLPLLDQTRGLVDAHLLRRMKPTAFLINMARGPVWKESDVVRALEEHWIAGAGSDVYEVEPAPADNPLFAQDSFVGTPHMAAHTEEGMIRMSMVARDIIAVLEGRAPEFPVPLEALK